MPQGQNLSIPQRGTALTTRDRYHLNSMLSRNLRIALSGKRTYTVDEVWRVAAQLEDVHVLRSGPRGVSEKVCRNADKWNTALKAQYKSCTYLEYLMATWVLARIARKEDNQTITLLDEREIIPFADPPKAQPKGDKPLPGQVALFGDGKDV
jgi:hypothetical protein